MWCVADLNEEYVARMEDVLDLYERPADPDEPVVCLDEKPVMLRADYRKSVPCKPGRIARRDYEYIRHGKANTFCAVAPRLGIHILRVTPTRSAVRFAEMLYTIHRRFPRARKIHLVLDNLNIHCEKSAVIRFGKRMGRRLWRRFEVHYTPKHASWLNQAEIAISMYANECLRKRRLSSIEALAQETSAHEMRLNDDERKIAWGFTKRDAQKKFRYYTASL